MSLRGAPHVEVIRVSARTADDITAGRQTELRLLRLPGTLPLRVLVSVRRTGIVGECWLREAIPHQGRGHTVRIDTPRRYPRPRRHEGYPQVRLLPVAADP